MDERLTLVCFKDSTELDQRVREELTRLAFGRDPEYWSPKHVPLIACCAHAARLGAKAAVIQRRIDDADFTAEYNAYYSRQFANIGRHCARFHFFSEAAQDGQHVLDYLDTPDIAARYLGFITLRPVVRTPVGASILRPHPATGFVRCADDFPVHLAGLSLAVFGTPFMQQDNAVGACAQASIWMALRTLRRREGERAYDPAQITGAATRYTISGRILPNRTGLTQPQVIEAIRAAGYSPHPIPFAPSMSFALGSKLNDEQLLRANRVLHAYVESGIPVLLILYPSSGGHAVVVIGHTFSETPERLNKISRSLERGVAISITHAVSWVPTFIIHNDNSGPYLPLEGKTIGSSYALDQTCVAIPLLPADVFLSGEEAFEYALIIWQMMLDELTASLNYEETAIFSEQFVVRLLLLDKSKIRSWAASSAIAPEVRRQLRLVDLPRRVWVMELHLEELYGAHATQNTASLVGFILLDSTGDAAATAMLMIYLNLPAFTKNEFGSLIVSIEAEWKAFQISATAPVFPFRDLDTA